MNMKQIISTLTAGLLSAVLLAGCTVFVDGDAVTSMDLVDEEGVTLSSVSDWTPGESRTFHLDELPEGCDCIITIGGDGTLIQAARATVGSGVPIIGINRGHMGYLTQLSDEKSIIPSIDRLIRDDCFIEERMMLRAVARRDGEVFYEEVALNEVMLARYNTTRSLRFDVYVNDTMLNEYFADGILAATPTGSTAKFAAGGKPTRKKDLASIAMSYGNVYVAQIAMGADYNQCVKAISEAESYEGPSLIIAYAPCISHGIKAGMSCAQTEEEKAVKAGYWHLFRYDPRNKAAGKSAFALDSKLPTENYQDFLAGEVRYDALKRANAERAKELFSEAEEQAKERLAYLEKLVVLYGSGKE